MPEYVPPEAEDAYVVYEDDGAPAPDLDAPLIEHRYERTEPKDVGAPWDMAAWIAADRERKAAAGTFHAGGDIEVVAPGWWCEPDDLPRSPKPIAKRLLEQGWETRCCASIAYVTETLYAHASDKHSKGDLRYRDHDDTSWSIQAVLRRQERVVAAFWATWVTREEVGRRPGTSFVDAITQDIVIGREYHDTAGSFEEWLNVFSPAPPKPEKRKRAATA